MTDVPKILGLPVTYRCDAQCAMCSIWLKQKGAAELTLPQIDRFFAEPLGQIWSGENAERVREAILLEECPRCMTNCYPETADEIYAKFEIR
jgi:hypothetical protein